MEQHAHGFDVWEQPMMQPRLPMLFDLRSDPFERAQPKQATTSDGLSSMPLCSSRRRRLRGGIWKSSTNFLRAKNLTVSQSSGPWKSCATRRPAISGGRSFV